MAVGSKWSMKAEELWPILMGIATDPKEHNLTAIQKEALETITDIMMKYYKYLMPDKREEKHEPVPDQVFT